MNATTVQEQPAFYGIKTALDAEKRIILHGIQWNTYLALLKDIGDQPGRRLAYDNGDLEIMMPSLHGGYERGFDSLLNVLAKEFGKRYRAPGSMTCKREDVMKGIELDCCFYIQSIDRVRGIRMIDLDRDPPPDLMIEVDMTTNSLNKLSICSALRVPEHWRFDGKSLEIRVLRRGKYVLSRESPTFPGLPMQHEISRFLEMTFDDDVVAMQEAFQKWIRAHRTS